ncbi:DUF2382 domain-containing protein [Phormidesmis priestleyi]|nr:DUF2382 domain-containing protein [Phormidesmis priestleyi]
MKLQGFAVIDSEGRLIGEVSDLMLNDEQHLHLVVSQPDVNYGQRSFWIPSRVVSRVRSRSNTLSVTLTQADIQHFPEYQSSMQSSNESDSDAIATNQQSQELDLTSLEGLENQPTVARAQGLIDPTNLPKAVSREVVQEETIRLLEERLAVDYNRHKIGEVIIRKEVEIRIIEVPVRREKLIVEQISPDYRQLAEIDLGQGEIEGVELRNYQSNGSQTKGNHLTVSGEFNSPKTGAWLLDSIAHQAHHSCKKIRIEIEVEDPTHFDLYQGWFDRCSIREEQPD